MKKLFLAAAALAAGSLCLQDISTGHGGTYRGPGDTVPPGGGGGGGGGGPAVPGPVGPTGPGPAGPAGPGTTGGSAPTGGMIAGGNQMSVTGLASEVGADLTLWSFWWEFNKDPYLNLKEAIHADEIQTGSDDFFLGRGDKKGARNNLRPSEAQTRTVVVPALIRVLEKETNNDIVTGTLIALAKIGDEKSESGDSKFQKIIEPFLKDKNQEIAETAAVALGILANPESIGTLEELLKDSATGRTLVGSTEVNYRTRAFAAYGLGLIGYRLQEDQNEARARIVAALCDVIDSDKSSTRDVKVSCILALGLVPVTPLEPAVAPEKGAAPALPSSSRAAQIDYLVRFFEDDSQHYLVRAHAPTSIARLMRYEDVDAGFFAKNKEHVAQLFLEASKKSTDEKNEIIQSCVISLGMIGDNDADPIDAEIRKALHGMLETHNDQQIRNFSMIAAAQAGGHLGQGEDAGSKEAVDHLLKQIVKGKNAIQPWAGLGVGVCGHLLAKTGQDVPAALGSSLIGKLEDEKAPDLIGAYALGLGMLRDQNALEVLREKLANTKADEPRGYIAVALGMLGKAEVKGQIQEIVRESKYRPELLQQAAVGLGLLGDKELVGELVDMLKEAKGLATQAAISSALGFIGDSRSIDPLVQMLENKELTNSARGFAAVALGIVADKEKLPWNSKLAVDINYRASTVTLNDTEGTGILNIL